MKGIHEHSDRNHNGPIIGVGVVVLAGAKVLLVKRGTPPKKGEWSLPGGKQRHGETTAETAIREIREECGIAIKPRGLLDVVDLRHEGAHYTLVDYWAETNEGAVTAGDDAADVRWVPIAELSQYGLWSETVRIIEMAVEARDASK